LPQKDHAEWGYLSVSEPTFRVNPFAGTAEVEYHNLPQPGLLIAQTKSSCGNNHRSACAGLSETI
jgi:hypothetical protein